MKPAPQPENVNLSPAVSQTDLVVRRIKPGVFFEIEDVQTFCRTKAGTVTSKVRIGTTDVLSTPVAYTADTVVTASLVATKATRRGQPTDVIAVLVTTDGTGAVTDAQLRVLWRPLQFYA